MNWPALILPAVAAILVVVVLAGWGHGGKR